MGITYGLAWPSHGQGPGLPNLSYPSKSPMDTLSAIDFSTGTPRGHGAVSMHRGYLLVPFADDGGGGDSSGGFAFLDISNPENPVPVFTTEGTAPYNNPGSNQYAGRIRESHGWTMSGDIWCMTTNGGGSGLQFWDLSTPTAPVRLSQLNLSTLTGGDYSPTAWWVSWQGRYAYVASTSGGLHIVDATNPSSPVELSRIPTGSLGDLRSTPVLPSATCSSLPGRTEEASQHSTSETRPIRCCAMSKPQPRWATA